jgi:hypothetical protein
MITGKEWLPAASSGIWKALALIRKAISACRIMATVFATGTLRSGNCNRDIQAS